MNPRGGDSDNQNGQQNGGDTQRLQDAMSLLSIQEFDRHESSDQGNEANQPQPLVLLKQQKGRNIDADHHQNPDDPHRTAAEVKRVNPRVDFFTFPVRKIASQNQRHGRIHGQQIVRQLGTGQRKKEKPDRSPASNQPVAVAPDRVLAKTLFQPIDRHR